MDSRRLVDLVGASPAGHLFSTRRAALGLSLGGVVAGLSHVDSAAKSKGNKNKKRRKNKSKDKSKKRCPKPVECPDAPENPCAGKNWCIDRTQTCGKYSKCLVEATGGNICAAILYQVDTCAECEPPSCTDCQCTLATGGGDRCNNGVNGKEFQCVRVV